MTTRRLVEHYANKYAEEASENREPLAEAISKFPSNRFSAASTFIPPRLPRGAAILELGAGRGEIAQSMVASGVPFASYTIGDISTPRLQGLRTRLSDARFTFVEADAEAVQSTVGGAFDAILMVALIEHLVDPLGAMTQIRGLLRPGGFVYIDTPNIAKWTRRLRLLAGRFPSTASKSEGLVTYEGGPVDLYDEGHLHYFTYASLTAMLTNRCGFDRVEPVGYGGGGRLFGRRMEASLARRWPGMFSEIACFAYAGIEP